MLWPATVQRKNPAKRGFSPQQLQAQAGDAVFWFNEDTDQTHQPVPDSGKPWNIPPIPPRSSSQQLSLGTAGTFNYHCANHRDEKASLVVANAVLIAAGANPLFGKTTITAAGQCVSWGNSDAEAHQPCPNSGDPWFTSPINSGDLSAPITINQNVDYHCAIHPDNPAETGTIEIKSS